MHSGQAKLLFISAACFNTLVGIALLALYPLSARLLQLTAPPSLWTQLVAAIVLVFGYAYWAVAHDPGRFRPYVRLGIIGKLVFVGIIYSHWLAGDASIRLALLVTVDFLFAIAFSRYLLRTKASR